MKQNRNVSYLNQNKTKLNYVIKFSLIECSLFITSCFRLFGLHPARLHFCYTLQVKNPPPVSKLLIKSRAQAVREPV